jgi:hypothetical protein
VNILLRRTLWVLCPLILTGCGDSADTLLRTGVNYKSELTDTLMKVKDEESAKKFLEFTIKNYLEKNRILNEKWDKFIKDIEDDFRGKKKVIKFKTNADPGTEEWERDALNVPANEDPRIISTREAFITYMKKIVADDARCNREKERIKALVNSLAAEKASGEKGKDGENPVVNPNEAWPNLSKINSPETFKTLLMNGSEKRSRSGE